MSSLPSFREWDGPLTADLVRVPGRFGLGQVPTRLRSEATTTIVCGFCATGCGLTAHLKGGEAINLSGDPDYLWAGETVASAWGCGELFRDWRTPEAAFQILKKLSAGRPCDITGIPDDRFLDAMGGMQWPFSAELRDRLLEDAGVASLESLPTASLGAVRERRLFADGTFPTADGRARFLFDLPRPRGGWG